MLTVSYSMLTVYSLIVTLQKFMGICVCAIVCLYMCLLTIVFWHNNRVEASPPAAVVSRKTRGEHHTLQARILTTARSLVRKTATERRH